jgi:hypothetical protein
MSDEHQPMPQADGSLDPPRRPPPTAVATSAPLPEPVSGPVRWLPARRQTVLGRWIERALDALDEIGDTVREAFVPRP